MRTKMKIAFLASTASLAAAQSPPFPFGNATNDLFLPRNNDGVSARVPFPQSMRFLDSNATAVEQILNGYIRIYQGDSYYGYIHVYFMDIDTRNGGVDQNEIWLRVGNKTEDLTLARDIIAGNGTIFNPQAILLATWYKVEACCPRTGPKNTFQLAMPYSTTGETWAILAFTELQYFQSDGVNRNVASVTISDEFRTRKQEIAVVNTITAMNMLSNGTNCNRTGVYVFRINQGGPTQAPTNAPSKSPTKAPTSATCGLFGWSIFCPFTLCGIIGRWLGWCRNA